MTLASKRTYLVAEKATLESLIARLPADRILERVGLEDRLSNVTAELASLPVSSGQGRSDARSIGPRRVVPQAMYRPCLCRAMDESRARAQAVHAASPREPDTIELSEWAPFEV